MRVSIITPVWNRADLTGRFLQQNWQRYQHNSEIEWIVIDNASTDTTQSTLAYWKMAIGDRLRVITKPENIGFGPANNEGAKFAYGDILIFISNDVVVQGDYVAPLKAAIPSNHSALYGAQLFSHNTGWNTFEGIGNVPYLAGWCVACTNEFWRIMGGFDERYVPCDYEDLDLSYRVSRAGYKLTEVNLPLHHESGQSAQSLSGGRLAITLESQQKFLDKWGLELAR